MGRERNNSSDVRKDLERFRGNERKDNLRWGGGRGDERGGKFQERWKKKKGKGRGGRAAGREKMRLQSDLRPNRQRAVLGVRGHSVPAERAQRVHLDGADLPLMLSPAQSIGRTGATAIFKDLLV